MVAVPERLVRWVDLLARGGTLRVPERLQPTPTDLLAAAARAAAGEEPALDEAGAEAQLVRLLGERPPAPVHRVLPPADLQLDGSAGGLVEVWVDYAGPPVDWQLVALAHTPEVRADRQWCGLYRGQAVRVTVTVGEDGTVTARTDGRPPVTSADGQEGVSAALRGGRADPLATMALLAVLAVRGDPLPPEMISERTGDAVWVGGRQHLNLQGRMVVDPEDADLLCWQVRSAYQRLVDGDPDRDNLRVARVALECALSAQATAPFVLPRWQGLRGRFAYLRQRTDGVAVFRVPTRSTGDGDLTPASYVDPDPVRVLEAVRRLAEAHTPVVDAVFRRSTLRLMPIFEPTRTLARVHLIADPDVRESAVLLYLPDGMPALSEDVILGVGGERSSWELGTGWATRRQDGRLVVVAADRPTALLGRFADRARSVDALPGVGAVLTALGLRVAREIVPEPEDLVVALLARRLAGMPVTTVRHGDACLLVGNGVQNSTGGST